jgi:hypothetical protein
MEKRLDRPEQLPAEREVFIGRHVDVLDAGFRQTIELARNERMTGAAIQNGLAARAIPDVNVAASDVHATKRAGI